MVDSSEKITVDFLGTKLINPFVLASAPPTKDYETIKNGFLKGWAGAVTKSISAEQLKDKNPRIAHIKHDEKIVGTQNYEMGSVYQANQWVEWVDSLRKEFPDRLLYVSIFASKDLDEWKILSETFTKTRIHGLELNFSCPHSDHNGKGSVIGQNPDLCASITAAVKETVGNSLKIMPKLTYLSHPNEGFISKMCIDAGADAIAGINTIAGLCEIDASLLKPKLLTGEKTTAGGFSYDTIRPFGRLIIAGIANSINWKKTPISAMGGVSRNTDSIIEYLALGANHLQVCTEVMNNGFEVINEMKKNILSYLKNENRTLDSVRGAALPYITSWDKLDNIERIAYVNPENCSMCYECLPLCTYNAINDDNIIPSITEDCEGCGSCYSACPEKAITLIRR
jgi:dihydropyrimidine dehydrogenase (NAD+) subunit PreA